MSACGSSFSASLALLLYLRFPFFSFFFPLFVFVASFFPTTLDYARKIGNPGPHYSTLLLIFLFIAVFSRSSGLRSFLLRPSSPSISSWSNILSVTSTEWRNRSFIAILSADRFPKQNFNREMRQDISMVVHVIIRETKRFQFLSLSFFFFFTRSLKISL